MQEGSKMPSMNVGAESRAGSGLTESQPERRHWVIVFEQSKRRDLLRVALSLGASLPALKFAGAADNPANLRPQVGDLFVFFSGDNKGGLHPRGETPN
jgi:hypothetical protein